MLTTKGAQYEGQTLKLTYHDENDGKYRVNFVYIGDGSRRRFVSDLILASGNHIL